MTSLASAVAEETSDRQVVDRPKIGWMPALHVLRVFVNEDGEWGNPLGVFLEGGRVPEPERQRVAAELGFSETVFVEERAAGRLRIHTPRVELPFRRPPLGRRRLAAGARGNAGGEPAAAGG